MKMFKFVMKRVLIALLTIFVLSTLTFFLMKLIPGDPFQNDHMKPYVRELQRAYYGLDQPVWRQYIIYMRNLLHGDLGTSMTKPGRSVLSIIMETYPVSAKLGISSLIVSETLGLIFGVICAQFRGKWPDYVLMLAAVVGVALPSMVVGPLMRYYFGVRLRLFPVTGWGTLAHYIMPSLCLGIGAIAGNTRSMRAFMLNISTQDYVKAARAKGFHPFEVMLHYELKNSLLPCITNLGGYIAGITMGSFVIEQIFLIPGLGKYYVDSITNLDYPVIMGTTIFFGTMLVILNMLVDLLFGVIDPRIRLEED